MTVLFFCLAASFVYGYWENNTSVEMLSINDRPFWIERNKVSGRYRACATENARGKNVIPNRLLIECDKWHRPYQLD